MTDTEPRRNIVLNPKRDPDEATVTITAVWYDHNPDGAYRPRVEMRVGYDGESRAVWMNDDDIAELIQALLEVTQT